MQRAQRKLEHIRYALEIEYGPQSTHFEDIRFVHSCLPEINPADINLSVDLFGKSLQAPFMIDAITGGTDAVSDINKSLAVIAASLGIGMAVGSQFGTVKTGSGYASYEVIRKYNPDGIIFANISALASPDLAQDAVNMIDADALEVHLNPAQELFMPEGDKDFSNLLRNLVAIRDGVSVPVIIKETGCGIALEEYDILLKEGFTFFDCAGAGGTNFPAIEAKRAGINLSDDFLFWGNPTCWSILDGSSILDSECILIGSGGIDNASKAVKALALGADVVAMSGAVLDILTNKGISEAERFFEELSSDLKNYMLLLGCRNCKELHNVPLIFFNDTISYMQCRGFDITKVSKYRRKTDFE